MLNWLRRKRLSAEARRKLLIVAARSEEALIETHVVNVLDLMRTLQGEVDLERALEIYGEMMALPESLSTTVGNRILARMETPGGRPAATRAGRRYENVFSEQAFTD